MNRVLVVGGGMGVARMLLEAALVASKQSGAVVVVDGGGDSANDGVLVCDEDGTTQVGTLTVDEAQMLVALRGQPTFDRVMTLNSHSLALHEPWLLPEINWEPPAVRKAHWQQSKYGSAKKFQSMQAKARRR